LFYCPKACNKVADLLANYGSKMFYESQAVWPGDAPTFIHGLVSSNLAGPLWVMEWWFLKKVIFTFGALWEREAFESLLFTRSSRTQTR
jgi:hypothetical protein